MHYNSNLAIAEQLSLLFKNNYDLWDKEHDYEPKSFSLSSLSTELTRGLDIYIKDEDIFAICWLKFVCYLVVTISWTFDAMCESLRAIRLPIWRSEHRENDWKHHQHLLLN